MLFAHLSLSSNLFPKSWFNNLKIKFNVTSFASYLLIFTVWYIIINIPMCVWRLGRVCCCFFFNRQWGVYLYLSIYVSLYACVDSCALVYAIYLFIFRILFLCLVILFLFHHQENVLITYLLHPVYHLLQGKWRYMQNIFVWFFNAI